MELLGGPAVGPVPGAADHQHGTAERRDLMAEVQLRHGGGETAERRLGKACAAKGPLGQQPEHQILDGQQTAGHGDLRRGQRQSPDVVRVVQGIVEGQNGPQGQSA